MSETGPDAAFADRRLASLYDLAEHEREDLVHYERIADELGARSVLDLGCGTGTFVCSLAARGLSVVGVDPARASLDLARKKPNAAEVRWILGDAQTAAAELAPESLDLATMTGNVAQVFVSDDGWQSMMEHLAGLVRPGGYVVFEVRDPAYRGWEEWTREQSHSFLESPTQGRVETWVDLVEVALPLVTFRWTFRFERDGTELQSESTLRFRDRQEIELALDAAGFETTDVRQAPDRPNKELVFIARRRR